MAGYIIWDAFYTVANVPYGSLLSIISNKPADRASLSAWRSIGSTVGNMLPMVILPFLVYNPDKSLNGPMVFVAALVMGVLGFICFQFMIKNTEIRVDTDVTVNEDQPKFNVFKAMGNFLKNRPAVGGSGDTYVDKGAGLDGNNVAEGEAGGGKGLDATSAAEEETASEE